MVVICTPGVQSGVDFRPLSLRSRISCKSSGEADGLGKVVS